MKIKAGLISKVKVDLLIILIVAALMPVVVKGLREELKIEIHGSALQGEEKQNPATVLKQGLKRDYNTITKKGIFFPDGIYPEDKPTPRKTPKPKQQPKKKKKDPKKKKTPKPTPTPEPTPVKQFTLLGTVFESTPGITGKLNRVAILLDDTGNVFKLKEGMPIYGKTVLKKVKELSVIIKDGKKEKELKIFQIER